jgi:hypothetical protein
MEMKKIENPYTTAPADYPRPCYGGYKVVFVVYPYGWSAYRGLTSWTDEEVADSGDKISKEVAEALFPSVAAMGGEYQY